jgi:hypothetical protein
MLICYRRMKVCVFCLDFIFRDCVSVNHCHAENKMIHGDDYL